MGCGLRITKEEGFFELFTNIQKTKFLSQSIQNMKMWRSSQLSFSDENIHNEIIKKLENV